MGKKFLAGFKLFLSTVLVFFLLCSVVVADPLYAKDGCVPFLGAEKTFREIRAKFVDGELKEFPQIPDSLKVFLGLKAESVTLQSCFALPYFNIWPLPSQCYKSRRPVLFLSSSDGYDLHRCGKRQSCFSGVGNNSIGNSLSKIKHGFSQPSPEERSRRQFNRRNNFQGLYGII